MYRLTECDIYRERKWRRWEAVRKSIGLNTHSKFMFRMEIDSPTSDNLDQISPQERIIQRLKARGVPSGYLERLQPGLTAYYKDNKFQLPNLVAAILFTDDTNDVESAHFQESMVWLQWLMFEGDPEPVLKNLASSSLGQRGVCGAVWGNNDIAYRCRTCEHDPTCAICVPCFQNGNHRDHDYSIIYTGGGCCDCGDVTAWKREGFCSKHKGAEQIQPLPKELADTMGPVLNLLFSFWKGSLSVAETVYLGDPNLDDRADELRIADGLANAVVHMLLEFCNCSESLLSFTSGRVVSSAGLLDILVRAERFLRDDDVRELQGLLLKMLSEPLFKYEFAKVFLNYYPVVVREAIRDCNDTVFKKFPLLSTFSVQIFTVPTLTPRLVKEKDLLVLLLECLGNIFVSCAGEDGRLEISKWTNLYETTLRVVEDIRFVLSHSVVPIYIVSERRDIVKMWMKLLAFMQGMAPQKRETGIHIEEENENMHLPFVLGHSIANIRNLLVAGGFPESSVEEKDDENLLNTYKSYYDDQDSLRHAKVGKHSEESSVSREAGRNTRVVSTSGVGNIKSDLLYQPGVSCLTNECLKAIESWLRTDNTSGTLPRTENKMINNFFGFKNTLSKFRKGLTSISEFQGRQHTSMVQNRETGSPVDIDVESGQVIEQNTDPVSMEENTMETEYATEGEALHALSLSDWPNISYDVSSKNVSVHIPFHQLLSLILQRAVRKCYGELTSPKTDSVSSLYQSSAAGDFFGNVLNGCHPNGFSGFLMEHPLRIRVFCAQVHAGMWKKNGDGAILSWDWYRSVRWSQQGLELDLFLLQCCAALAPADLYVGRIVERFGLLDYFCLNVDSSSEYEAVLVHEMLIFIIQIIQERRFCGLSPTASLQRELIYKLAIGNATRSQLLKSLPRDLSKIKNLQEVLNIVAVYSNPSGMNQGTYKLRKEFWKQLDLYHPRLNSRDLQIVEERYLRFCQASALTSQLPKWTSIYKPFDGIAKIAISNIVLKIIHAVLFYAVYANKPKPSRAPDSVLLTALHLLSLALDICLQQRGSSNSFPILASAGRKVSVRHANGIGDESLLSLLVASMKTHRRERSDNFSEACNFNFSPLIENLLKKMAELDSGCMRELQKLAPEVISHLSHSAVDSGSYQGGPVSEVDKRKAKARERQAAIMEKMRAQQSKFLESVNSSATDELEVSKSGEGTSDRRIVAEESTQDVCSLCHDYNSKSPLCFLMLLQKSKLVSLVDRGPLSWKDICHSKNKCLLEMSSSSDSSTSTSNSEQISPPLFNKQMERVLNEVSSEGHRRKGNTGEMTFPSLETLENHIYLSIRQQMHDNNMARSDILERDLRFPMKEESPNIDVTESLLLEKYINALSKEASKITSASESTRSRNVGPSELSKPVSANDGFGPVDCDGIYVSSCGHAVHQACLDRYLSSVKERYLRRIAYEGVQIVDPDQGEFLCPVCRGLANSALSASREGSERLSKHPRDSMIRGLDSISCSTSVNKEIENLFLLQALSLLRSAADVAGRGEILRAFPKNQVEIPSQHLERVFRILSGLYFPGKQDKALGSERLGHSMIMWDTLKYSLVSTEIASRSRRSSVAPNFTTDALFKELKSTKGFILSLLLRIAEGTRTKNCVTVLTRLRGIQLFAKSIYSPSDDFSSHSLKQEGDMSYILEKLGSDVPYPEEEFWRRASDPILSSDAFSSLMWVLFCLPSQFLSCEDSFMSLLHLFYGVSVAQAIITYFGKSQCNPSELGYEGVLVTEIFNIMLKYGVTKQYFISNHLDQSHDLKSIIRSLSFPYLRRCALMWKVMNTSTPAPFGNGAQVSNSLSHTTDVMMEDLNGNDIMEPAELDALEKKFNIPPLDIVLNNEVLCSLVSRWLLHFNKEFEVRNAHRVLPMTPAVPFKLMDLPTIYQDLLQRYIKQHCPDCNAPMEEPALCLLCGKLCCPSWKTCCRECGCQAHAMACGAGVGVFLMVRKTTILLQRAARQANWPSPYLDVYGEEDFDMYRGKPLYLNEERYASLTYMVASHGIDQSSKVLRQTTIGAFLML